MNRQTYRTKIRLQDSPDLKAGALEPASGYVRFLPSGIYYKDSIEWVTEIDEYEGQEADFTGATCKLYTIVGDTATEIGTGTVSAAPDANVITWQIDPESIPAAAVNVLSYVRAEIISGTAELTSFYQNVRFVSLTDTTPAPGSTLVETVNEISGPDVVLDSDDIGEGTVNLYMTTSERAAIAAIDDDRKNLSAGMVTAPSYLDNGDGSVTLGNFTCRLYSDSDFGGNIDIYSITGGTFTLTDNDVNYLVADYNSGSPILRLTLDVDEINESDILPVYSVTRLGLELCKVDWNTMGIGLSNKQHFKDVKLNRFEREEGLTLGETGTRNVTTEAGLVWNGTKRNTLEKVDTSLAGSDICFFYHVSGSWQYSTITQYNNTQYDDGTDLQELTSGRYAVCWIWRNVDATKKRVCMLLGGGDYTIAQAEASTIPTPPDIVTATCFFVGRIIVQKSATTATAIEQVQDVSLSYSPVSNHNDLSGIDGGEAGYYGHLTSDEYSRLQSRTIETPSTAVTQYKAYYLDGSTWTLADIDVAACETCELFFSTGTNVTDGMITAGQVTNAGWAFTTVGALVWIDDDGAITETKPTASTHAGQVARPCGFVRSATSIYFDGHIMGASFSAASV